MMPICQFSPQARADGAVRPLNMPGRNLDAPAVGCAHPEFAVQNGSAGHGAGSISFRPIIGAFAGSRCGIPESSGFDVFLAPHAALESGAMRASCRWQARRTLADWAKLGRTRLERIDDARFRLVCLWSCLVRLSRTGDRNQRWTGMLIPTGFVFLPFDALGHEGRPNVPRSRLGPAR